MSRTLSAVWQRFTKPTFLGGAAPGSNFIDMFFEGQPLQGNSSSLQLKFQATPGIPIQSLGRLSLTIERVAFSQGRKPEKPAKAAVNTSVTGKPDGSEFTLAYSGLARPAPGSWDVYRVRMRAGTGNLAMPAWVRQWSTPSDVSPTAADKTLNIDLLVEAMVRAITEEIVFSDHFIGLGRGF